MQLCMVFCLCKHLRAFVCHFSHNYRYSYNGFSVHLEAPDTVLLERYAGKRIDSLTGGE